MRTINKMIIQPDTPNDNKVLWLNKNNASYYNNGTWVTIGESSEDIRELEEKVDSLDVDMQTVENEIQDINSRHNTLNTKHESLSRTVQGIAATGGASTANNVTYNNDSSGLNAENAQDAIDELAAKNKTQDTIIEAKADKSEVATELDKKFDKENIAQEFGDSKDKVVSQFALPFREIESPEFIKAIVDTEDHFLFGIQLDGSIEWSKGIPAPIRAKLQEIINQCQKDKTDVLEAINAAKEELSANITALQEGKVDKEEGKSLIDADVADAHSAIEDPEGRTEITTDAEDKVMSYRDSYGKKHEHDMEVTNLDVSNLNLKGNSVNNIQDALKANGFDVKTPVDWSEYLSNDGKSPLCIPEPRCARINISGIDSMPTTKTTNAKAYFEMWDMQGNYFKKKVIINAQGNSTMQYPKKSFACDFFDSDWNGDSFAVKFGDWVAQDSFHFKAQYSDFFKGISIVAYKLVQEVWASRSPIYSNPWKKALLGNINITSGSYNAEIINDLSLQKDTGAKCIPDAFPCIVYLNDEFYGVFNWALKKHRDNYHMNKSLATNIHLDGGRGPMLSPLNWSSFEVRNPKGLLTNVATATGFESYDGDKPKELLGSDTEGYNPSDKKHVLSNKVKQSILTFNSMARELNAKTNENGGEEFLNEHYDLENLIDFYVLQYVLADEDISANWQWITYDGVKWFICDYDKDRTFGQIYNCPGVRSAEVMLNAVDLSNTNYPFKYLVQYHKEEIKARYNELKSLGIFTPEHVISLVKNWFNRFPIEAIKLEYKKWAESPSNRDDNVDREHWKIKGRSYEYLSDNTYDNEKTYAIGETCAYGKSRHVIFECIKKSTGNPPVTKFYDNIPYDLGYHDSIWRVTKYIQDRFTYIENEIIKL